MLPRWNRLPLKRRKLNQMMNLVLMTTMISWAVALMALLSIKIPEMTWKYRDRRLNSFKGRLPNQSFIFKTEMMEKVASVRALRWTSSRWVDRHWWAQMQALSKSKELEVIMMAKAPFLRLGRKWIFSHSRTTIVSSPLHRRKCRRTMPKTS